MKTRHVAGTVLVVLSLVAACQADVLFADVPVSDSGTSNSIAYPNTSRNVAIGPDGTIYVVYYRPNGIWVARSTNRGESFEASVRVHTSQLEAEIAADADGVVYVAWVQTGQARFSRSTDGGLTFSDPASLGAASGTVHMATDAPYVYLITRNGTILFRNANSGGGAFETTSVDNARAFADVHVDPQTGDVYVQTDDPTVRVFKSTDHGATFDGPHLPGGTIYYSTTVLASTDAGVYLYTCGNGSTALRIDVSDYAATTLTFGTTTISQGRTLAVDAFSNVIDGYVSNADVKYAISTDNGETFSPAVTIATASYLSLALNRRYGDIVAVYEQGGQIFCTVYGDEIVQAPTVDTAEVTDITTTSATCGGDVVTDGGSEVTVRGVCWSTSADPTTADAKTEDGAGTGTFVSEITGLDPGTTYHVRAYATNGVGTSYGADVEFTTAAVATAPAVTTAAVSDITETTAVCGGDVTNGGGAAITARGVCWSTSANPTTADARSEDGTGTGAYVSEITGLDPGTVYHVRAYATNEVGTSYGDDIAFTTSATTPTVTTAAVSNITETTAVCGGNVTSSGGAAVTARGVCWSTSVNPTVADSKTSNGTGTGAFVSSLTGLSAGTTYYARAYATNSAGTAYGDQRTFATAAAADDGGDEPVDAGGDPPAGDQQPPGGGDDEPQGGEAGEDDAAAATADLRVTIFAPSASVNVGEALRFRVVVQNVGNAPARNAVLRVPLPPGTTFVSASWAPRQAEQSAPLEAHVDADTIVLALGDVAAGESLSIAIVLLATSSGLVTVEANAMSDDSSAPATAQADREVQVDDVYWQIVETAVPVRVCGWVGVSPALVLLGLMGLRRREAVRRGAGRRPRSPSRGAKIDGHDADPWRRT